jgi:pyruvate dehydrogenase E1 component beta subunit
MSYGEKMEIPTEEYFVPIGKAKIVSSGNHLTLISHSRMVSLCQKVVEELKKKNISVELIDLRTIKPLDINLILASAVPYAKSNLFCVVMRAEVKSKCLPSLVIKPGEYCGRNTKLPFSINKVLAESI